MEGSRENLPELRSAIAQQLSAVIPPAIGLEPEAQPVAADSGTEVIAASGVNGRRKKTEALLQQ
jgi:hypothetical protein